MTDLSAAARNINWLVENFVDRVPGVKESVVVSADGLPMAVSRGLDRDAADRFAAVASGLIGLAYGTAAYTLFRVFEAEGRRRASLETY